MQKNEFIKYSIYISVACILALALFFQFNPFDPSNRDSDNDGYNDSIDELPENPNEHKDTDNDGVGDNSDKFPNDPAASQDFDDDGYPYPWNEGKDESDSTSNPPLILDEFPTDPSEYKDSDGDGVGDNSDVFPNDDSVSRDDDGDGIGNKKDKNPYVDLGFTLNIDKFIVTKFVDILPRAQIYFKIKINDEEVASLDNNGNYWRVWLNQEETIGFSYHYDIDDDTKEDTTKVEIIMYDYDIFKEDDLVDINSDYTDKTLVITINHEANSLNKNNESIGQTASLWFNTILPESIDPDIDYYEISYEWSYQMKLFDIDLQIPKERYNWFKNKDVNRSPQQLGTSHMANFVTENEAIIIDLSNQLINLASNNGYNNSETVNFILSFVQQNVIYKEDIESKNIEEYWKYPVESLVDKKGDCEDSSILFQSIIKNTKYDVVMLFYIIDDVSGHLSSGVSIDEDISGYSINYRGTDYYYCETTSQGFLMGQKPDDIPDSPEKIIPII